MPISLPRVMDSDGTAGSMGLYGYCATAAVMVAVGTAIVALATRWGIGLYPDSIVYVGAARNLLAGDGFQFLDDIGALAPVTQYPPGYSWLIALFGLSGLDALEAARWVSLFFTAANSLVVAFIAQRATQSTGSTLVAVFLSLAAFPLVYINSQALSEPPFIFLVLLGFCFLERYLERSDRVSIGGFALAIGLSCLVRYVGIAFGMTGAVVILLHGRGSWFKRFIDAAMFSTLAALPIVAWVVRNYLRAGNAVNRTFGFHLPAPGDLLPSLDTASQWLLPTAFVDAAPWPSRIFLMAVFLVFVCLALRLGELKSWYPRLMIYCVAGYTAFLFISFSFNDQPLYFDTRTMALPYAALMIAAAAIVTEWLRKSRPAEKSWRWFGFDCALVVVLALQLINGAVWLRHSYEIGIGFATDTWRHSELIQFARNAPASTPMVSNAPDFIYTLTGKRAVMIPHKVHPWTRQPNLQYAPALAAMAERLKQPDAVFIYFNDTDRLWYLPSVKELEAKLPMEKISTTSDGAIYRLHSASVTAK